MSPHEIIRYEDGVPIEEEYESDGVAIVRHARWPIATMVGSVSFWGAVAVATSGGATTKRPEGGAAIDPPSAPTVSVNDLPAGDSAVFTSSAFSGDPGDSHDSTIFEADTIDGTWAPPIWADSTGVNLLVDTAAAAFDSAGVYKVRALHCGATGGCSSFGDSTQFTMETAVGGDNEPAGMTEVSHHRFISKTPSGWGLNNPSNMALATDATAPVDPDSIGVVTFSMGSSGGTAPINLFYSSGWSNSVVYVRHGFKVSSNWQGHDSFFNKIGYLSDDDTGGGGDPWFWIMHGADSGTLRFEVVQQGPEGSARLRYNSATGVYSAISNAVSPTSGDVTITRDTWYDIEIVFTANTPGSSDGRVEAWIDGTKVLDYSGLAPLSSGSDGDFDNIKWNPVWGGGGDTISSDMTQSMDQYYFSGKN